MKKSIKWLAVLASTLAIGAFTFTACDQNKPPEPPPIGGDTEDITVTFINGNSTFKTVKGKAGDAIETLEAPTKEGYSFDGWETGRGEEFVPTTIPDADTTVYAKMTPNNYTVEFDSNGSTSANITYNATYDKDITVPQAALNFSKPGYDLAGWAKTATASAADYLLNAKLNNLTTVKDAKVTLYAYYSPKASIILNDFTIIENTDGEKTIVEYTGNKSEITLPSNCTKVAEHAFANNTTLRSVTVPATYKEIGFGAFKDCTSLEKLEVPFIGGGDEDNAFLAYIFGAPTYTDNNFTYNMAQVDGTLTIDESTLGGNFYIPMSLRTVILNARVDEIAEGAFYYAYGLERLVVYTYENADGGYEYPIKKVGKSAFEGCHRLGADIILNIPYRMDWLSGVETFEEKSFKGYVSENSYYTGSLMDIGTLSSAKVIGDEAFAYNSKLNYLYFGDKLESIGNSAFKSANFLQIIDIPDSCVSIGEEAFYGCAYLASVALGNGIKTIGEKAFAICPALTEVFFYGEVPANIPNNVFYGFDEENSRQLDDVNPGLVFYFPEEDAQASSEGKLKQQYPSALFGVAGNFGGPFYCIDTTYEYILYFTEGHVAVIYDPYFRSGYAAFVMMAGKYEKVDTLYDAEMYNINLLGNFEVTAKIDYHILSSSTHYYKYKIASFTLEELREDQTSVKIGSKTDEWYIEENAYGQIALWNNGEFFGLQEGASFVSGGVSAFYANGTIREIHYYQSNEFFEPIQKYTYTFLYTPDPDKADTSFERYGKLTLLEEDETGYTYESYVSSDGKNSLTLNGYTNELTIAIGDNEVVRGKYETVSETEGESIVLALDGYSVELSGFKQNVTTNGTYALDIYSLCKVTAGTDTYVLYNSNYLTATENYYLNAQGEPTLEKYLLVQYAQIAGESVSYSGHAEYTNAEGAVEYVPYEYKLDEFGRNYYYIFHTAAGDVNGTTSESGFAVGNKIFRAYVEREKGSIQRNGDVAISLSGYGTATYVDKDNPSGLKGYYGVASSFALSRVYVSEDEYYDLYEYVFISGNFRYYFIPNFYDAADGSLKAGAMQIPDKTRNQRYRVYDPDSNYCMAEFRSYGYGIGEFYILKYPDSMVVAAIEDYENAAGATMVRYTKIGERDGEDVYLLAASYSLGFFTFTFKDDVLTYGKVPVDEQKAVYPSYEMVVDSEYKRWWMEFTNFFVCGKITPPDEVLVPMVCREEKGVYTANGYTLELDGYGNAILTPENGEAVEAEYGSAYDANLNGNYTFVIAVDENTTYRGQLNTANGNIKVNINGVEVEFVKVVDAEETH